MENGFDCMEVVEEPFGVRLQRLQLNGTRIYTQTQMYTINAKMTCIHGPLAQFRPGGDGREAHEGLGNEARSHHQAETEARQQGAIHQWRCGQSECSGNKSYQ